MDKKGIANYVMRILQKTFDALDDACENNLEGKGMNANSHLIFPKYSKKENYRVSEQELRFEFIHQFLKNQEENEGNVPKLYYSIETPTKEKYRFSKPKNSAESDNGYPRKDETGESAQFDVVLFNEKAQRVCFIEFKAKNPSGISYEKDLLKLNTEGKEQACFFVQLLTGFNDETRESINKKLFQLDDNGNKKENGREELCLNDTIYICHVLKCGLNFYIDGQNVLDLPQSDERHWPLIN